VQEMLTVCRLKLKRPQTVKAFRQHLDDCYEEALAEESKPKAKL
jgi:long-chain acyl-CoA synthetase